ncbi:MAG: Gfo/Idh/MocA family oxidoreductase, partial [Sphingomicrobium sp.]
MSASDGQADPARASSYRFGLIGCGHIARRHADLLSRGQVPGAALAAVCDIVPERAQAFGEKYGVASTTNLDDLLAKEDVDVACILTPSGLHHDHCLSAAAAGKHVLVEKPMALTVAECEEMIVAAEAAGKVLMAAQVLRFFPAYTA